MFVLRVYAFLRNCNAENLVWMIKILTFVKSPVVCVLPAVMIDLTENPILFDFKLL